jgi:putative MATE family efflux protein
MLYLALPVLVEQLLNMLVGLVDTWLTGNYLEGDACVAAIGLMAYVLWLLPCMFSTISIGATALTARFVGAGDRMMAVRVANQALLVGVIAAVAGTALMYFFGQQFIGLMQLKGAAALLAGRYLAILVPVIPAMMIQQVGVACLRGAGDTVTGFVAMTIVNLVNIGTSASLMLGVGPLPKLGWDGLAIGTACGHVVGALIILVVFIRGRAGLKWRFSLLAYDASLVRRLLRVGLPGGADVTSVLFCHLWYVSIINAIGTEAAAAHGIGVRIESLSYLPGAAFAVAATTLAGQFLGAGDHRRAVKSVLMALLAGGGIMTMAAVCFFSAADSLARFFLGAHSVTTVNLAADLLRIVAFATPGLAVAMIFTGALRGAGDTRWPLAVTLFGFLGIRIPLAYYLAWDTIYVPVLDMTLHGLGGGVVAAWYAMLVETWLRAALITLRFWQGGWKRVKV